MEFVSSGLFPYEIMREQLKPVFFSQSQLDGRDIVVAMLAEIIREDENSETGEVEN